MKKFNEVLVEVRKMFAKKVILKPKKEITPEAEQEPIVAPTVQTKPRAKPAAKPKTVTLAPAQEPVPPVATTPTEIIKKTIKRTSRKTTTVKPETQATQSNIQTDTDTKFKWSTAPVPPNVQWPGTMSPAPVTSPVNFPSDIAPKETKQKVSFPSDIKPQPVPPSNVNFSTNVQQATKSGIVSFDDSKDQNILTHSPTGVRGHGDTQKLGGHDSSIHWGIAKINDNIQRMKNSSSSTSMGSKVGAAVLDFLSKHPGQGIDGKIHSQGSLPLEKNRKATDNLKILSTNVVTDSTNKEIRHTITLDASHLKGSNYNYQHTHVGEAIDQLRNITGLEYHGVPENKTMAKNEGKIQLRVSLTHPELSSK